MKIINDFLDIILFFITILIVGGLVLFVEVNLVSQFQNIFMQFAIRIMCILFIYFVSRMLKVKTTTIFILIFGFISITTYVLFFSEKKENKSREKNVSIQQKSVFKSEEIRKKYLYGTIEDKIIILKDMGFSKEQVYQRLKNNVKFKELIKNGNK